MGEDANSSLPVDDGGSVQRFADHLVDCFGVEGALRVCRENHWNGVLLMIRTGLDTEKTAGNA